MRPRKERPPGCPGGLGFGSACKPRSVHHRQAVYGLAAFIPSACGWAIISLGPASPRGSCSLPGARRGRAAPWIPVGTVAPAWPCSRRGLPGRSHCWPRRWSLTPPFHPDLGLRRGGLFLWPCPRVAPPGGYPAPCSVERGLSSAGRTGRDRPAHPTPTSSYPSNSGTRSSGYARAGSEPLTWYIRSCATSKHRSIARGGL